MEMKTNRCVSKGSSVTRNWNENSNATNLLRTRVSIQTTILILRMKSSCNSLVGSKHTFCDSVKILAGIEHYYTVNIVELVSTVS